MELVWVGIDALLLKSNDCGLTVGLVGSGVEDFLFNYLLLLGISCSFGGLQ
jgi:hypothetical protein